MLPPEDERPDEEHAASDSGEGEAPKVEAPTGEALEDDEPMEDEGPKPLEELPPHRLAGRALVFALAGGPLTGCLVSFDWSFHPTYYEDFYYLTLSVFFAGFCFVLALSAGLARRLRRGLRAPALGVVALLAPLAGGVALVWAMGLADGGPTHAIQEVQGFLGEILGEAFNEALTLGLGGAVVFVLLGLLQCDGWPAWLSGSSRRLWFQVVVVVVAGVVAWALTYGIRGDDGRVMFSIYGVGALGCGVGQILGERLDAFLVRKWRAALDG